MPNKLCEYCNKLYVTDSFTKHYCGVECRFLSKVEKSEGCWDWKGSKKITGYGSFHYKGKTYCSSRASYELFVGDIPSGMLVLHKCDRSLCVNPEHLFIGTQLDNIKDMVDKKRQQKGESHCHHKLTQDQANAIKDDARPQVIIAKEYNISKGSVNDIKKGRTWTHDGHEIVQTARRKNRPDHPQNKLTAAQVMSIRADTRHRNEIIAEYDIKEPTYYAIMSGRNWKHLL